MKLMGEKGNFAELVGKVVRHQRRHRSKGTTT